MKGPITVGVPRGMEALPEKMISSSHVVLELVFQAVIAKCIVLGDMLPEYMNV
jgi:hypothetical protein